MRLQAGKTSLVRALMSPSSNCASIDVDDRTVGIDCYNMQLTPNHSATFADSAVVPSDRSKGSEVSAAFE